jgi:O-antigen/teichoic acid export membrane protein
MSSSVQPTSRPALSAAVRLQSFLSDVGALGALQLLQRLPGLILLPIISHAFGARGWGIWTLFFVAGELLGILCDMALDDALVRFVAGSSSREDQCEYFYSLVATVLGVSVVMALGLGLLAAPVATLIFGGVEAQPYVYLLCFYLVAASFDNLALNMMRALNQVRLFVILEGSQVLVRSALIIGWLLAGQSLWVTMLVYMGVQLVWLLVEFGSVYALIGFHWPRFHYLRECLAYSWPLVPTRYSNVILTYSDRLIISSLLGPAAAGVYAASYDLALLLMQIATPIRTALFPVISRLWDQGARPEAAQYLSRSMKLLLFLIIPGAVGLSLLAPQLLRFLSTAEFVSESYFIVPVAAIGVVCQALSLFFNMLLRLHKNTQVIAIGLVVSALVHLVLNFVLIPWLGIKGGALASLIGYGLDLGLIAWLAWRQSRFVLPIRQSLVFIAASILMSPMVWWVSQYDGWPFLLLAVGTGAGIYGVTTLALRGITLIEIRNLLNRAA